MKWAATPKTCFAQSDYVTVGARVGKSPAEGSSHRGHRAKMEVTEELLVLFVHTTDMGFVGLGAISL